MIINGNLYLMENYNLKSLGNLQIVYGDLNLRNTKITSLPNGLEVGGDLNLSYSQITKKYIEDNFSNLLKKCKW